MKLKLKEIIKEKGVKIGVLAEKAQIKQESLSRLINSDSPNPKLDTLEKIATALGVDIWELFTESTDKSKMIALIYGDQLYRASTLEELQIIVDELKNKCNE